MPICTSETVFEEGREAKEKGKDEHERGIRFLHDVAIETAKIGF